MSDHYSVVLQVMNEQEQVVKEFIYPVGTRELAEFLWETLKKRMEGYH